MYIFMFAQVLLISL